MNIPILINPECEHFRSVEEAVDTVNGLQKFFRLSIVEAEWLPNDEKRRVTDERIRRLVEKNFQEVAADKPCVAVRQNPFDDNVFSSEYRYLHIITVADWEKYFAPPPVKI